MGEAGRQANRKRLRLACGERAIPGALERTGRAQSISPQQAMPPPGLWPMPHACLPPTPALLPLQGPWWLISTGQRSQPAYRHHADLLSAAADSNPFSRQPCQNLQGKRQELGNGWTSMILNSSTVNATSQHTNGAGLPTCLRNWRL